MPENQGAFSRAEALIERNGLGDRVDREAVRRELQMSDAGKTGLTLKILSVVGGLIASSTLSGFFLSSGLMETAPALFLSGLLFVFGAIHLNRKADNLVLDTFTISIFLLGFLHLAMTMNKLEWELDRAILMIGCIALVALSLTKGYMLSFFSTLIASASILLFIAHRKWYDGIHAYVVLWVCLSLWLYYNESRVMSWGDRFSRQYPPVRIVAVLSLIVALFFVCNNRIMAYGKGTLWITSLATTAGILYVVHGLAPLFGFRSLYDRLTLMAGTLLLMLPLWLAPALTGSVLIVLLGFRTADRTAFSLGILAFLYFTVQYYYDLDITLLDKSYVMMSTGALFMALFLLSHRKLKSLETP